MHAMAGCAPAPSKPSEDAPLPVAVSYPLAPQSAVTSIPVPLRPATSPPEWIVPSRALAVQAGAISGAPVMFDFGPFPGDPDVAAAPGSTAWAQFPAAGPGALPTPVTPGLWYAIPAQAGPYPVSGARAATATMGMTATAAEFDPAVSTPQGDFWQFAVAPLAAHAHYSLLRVNPGRAVTIPVTITPTGTAGSVVHGTLFVDDFVDSMSFLSGSELAALSYQYTIS